MKSKILNCILYGGITKDEYKEIEAEINLSNLKNLFVFCCFAFIAYSVMFVLVSHSSFLSVMCTIYKVSAIYYFSIVLISAICIKTRKIFRIAPYIGIAGALILGAIIGVFVNGNSQTTTFMVFLFAIPLLFTTRPCFVSLVILIVDLFYIYLIKSRQAGMLLINNLYNAIVYGIMSILFSGYMMNLKIKAIANARNYKFLMENDQLTGLNNRRSFDNFLEKIKTQKLSCTIISFDINSLKIINDTKGHKTGDELIIAVAQCISKTFSEYGHCFRIGGDEFVAILDKPLPSLKDLCEEFENNCRSFQSEDLDDISVAYGIVTYDGHQDTTIEEALYEVDARMYENKEIFYSKKNSMELEEKCID